MATKQTPLDAEIFKVCDILRKGGVILYPTDTVWGIGCDATNKDAVNRIYQIKKRADNKAMIVLLDSARTLEQYVENVPDIALQLLEITVKPTTIVYDRGIGLAPNLLGQDGSIGIRITNETFSQRLCRALRRPLVSTSANVSGQPTAANFDDIQPEILNAVDYIVNYRRDDKTPHIPSSVIRLTSSGEVRILRP